MQPLKGMCCVRSAAMLLVLALLAGCAGLGERREAPAGISDPAGEDIDPGASGPAESTRSTSVPAPAPGDAGSSLMAAALQARSAGESDRAIALLERAQRIDPDNGELYLELSRTHFAAGNAAQGRAMAERGLLYCQGAECPALRALIR